MATAAEVRVLADLGFSRGDIATLDRQGQVEDIISRLVPPAGVAASGGFQGGINFSVPPPVPARPNAFANFAAPGRVVVDRGIPGNLPSSNRIVLPAGEVASGGPQGGTGFNILTTEQLAAVQQREADQLAATQRREIAIAAQDARLEEEERARRRQEAIDRATTGEARFNDFTDVQLHEAYTNGRLNYAEVTNELSRRGYDSVHVGLFMSGAILSQDNAEAPAGTTIAAELATNGQAAAEAQSAFNERTAQSTASGASLDVFTGIPAGESFSQVVSRGDTAITLDAIKASLDSGELLPEDARTLLAGPGFNYNQSQINDQFDIWFPSVSTAADRTASGLPLGFRETREVDPRVDPRVEPMIVPEVVAADTRRNLFRDFVPGEPVPTPTPVDAPGGRAELFRAQQGDVLTRRLLGDVFGPNRTPLLNRAARNVYSDWANIDPLLDFRNQGQTLGQRFQSFADTNRLDRGALDTSLDALMGDPNFLSFVPDYETAARLGMAPGLAGVNPRLRDRTRDRWLEEFETARAMSPELYQGKDFPGLADRLQAEVARFRQKGFFSPDMGQMP